MRIQTQKIRILDYGAGNIASVMFALNRLGVRADLTSDPAELAMADKLIFPGVGHAGAAMQILRESGLDRVLSDFSRPLLGICLGMQLMFRLSEEGNTRALGLFPDTVRRFPAGEKVPHMGWNQIFDIKGSLFQGIEEGSHFYFVHSYYVPPGSYTQAMCYHGTGFSAAISHKMHFGVQFHPEKSGEPGMQLLKNFLNL